jgi:formiminotetrahydrofolate cyclodeaminase
VSTPDAAPRAAHESLAGFLARLASSSPTPGGGAVAALAGALAAALGHMVASLTVGKKKYADVEPEFRRVMPGLLAAIDRLQILMDEDAHAFDAVMAAMKLPKDDDAQVKARDAAVEAATVRAAKVPLETLNLISTLLPAIRLAAEKGNAHAVSDAGMAALLVICGAKAAAMNVRINVKMLHPRFGIGLHRELQDALAGTIPEAERIERLVDEKLAR